MEENRSSLPKPVHNFLYGNNIIATTLAAIEDRVKIKRDYISYGKIAHGLLKVLNSFFF
jgi:hypothetical protein